MAKKKRKKRRRKKKSPPRADNQKMPPEIKREKYHRGRRPPEKLEEVDTYETVRNMGFLGMSVKDIGFCLGWSRATIFRRRHQDAKLDEAIGKGLAMSKRSYLLKVHDKAMSGDMEALKFMLSRVHGMYERRQYDIHETQSPGRDYEDMTFEELVRNRRKLERRLQNVKGLMETAGVVDVTPLLPDEVKRRA